MINNIFISPTDNTTIFSEYLDFNKVMYTSVDLWTYQFDEFGGFYIPDHLLETANNLLIIDHETFENFLSWDVGINHLIQFTKQNQIWLYRNIDSLIHHLPLFKLESIYPLINYKNITSFVDGQDLINRSLISSVATPVNWFTTMPRIKCLPINKRECNYDFLLTTTIKPGREHREILLNMLSNRKNLKSRGLISCNSVENKHANWLGDSPHQHHWCDGYPSMDLYSQCWFEIVPETMYQDGNFYTEKTNKPIATKTPFLTVSTKGYLDYLKSLGFKTFDSLINESYDQQDSIEDRVSLMLEQVENIIANGSEQFYNSAKPILDYNYNHLAEISGKWDHLMDAFITQQLERVGFKL